MILVSLLLCCLRVIADAQDVKSIASAVDAHYNHLRSLQAEFTELYRGSGMERNESGTLWLKKPGKMRWEYRSPKEKLFVGAGGVAGFLARVIGQVLRRRPKRWEVFGFRPHFCSVRTSWEKGLKGLR